MTVLVPNADEAERDRLPGGGANVQPHLGARAHARRPRVGGRRASDRRGGRACEARCWRCAALALGLARLRRASSAPATQATSRPPRTATVERRARRSRTGRATSTRARTTRSRKFTERTGVEVEYIEDVNDNAAFFGKVQPQLDQGESGGRSIFVVTDWMAKQMYDLGYLQKLDHDDLPTVFENIRPGIRSSELDPDRNYAIPWQSGMTGIWVDKAAGARHHLDQRPLRPQVQGPRDDAHRDARHRAAGDEGRRHRPGRGDHRGLAGGDRQDPARRSTRARSGASPATTTPRTSPAATRSPRSAGPATPT